MVWKAQVYVTHYAWQVYKGLRRIVRYMLQVLN